MKQGWTVIRSKEKFRSESVNKVQGSLRIILWWSSDISKSGRVGSSKNLSLHTKIEKSSKNCQKQLCQNSRKQSKIYSHQVSTESKKKKSNLKRVGKFCGIFICPCPTPSPVRWWCWRSQVALPMWSPSLWFQREQSGPYLQRIVFFCLICLGTTEGLIQGLVFVSLNWELTRSKKATGIS